MHARTRKEAHCIAQYRARGGGDALLSLLTPPSPRRSSRRPPAPSLRSSDRRSERPSSRGPRSRSCARRPSSCGSRLPCRRPSTSSCRLLAGLLLRSRSWRSLRSERSRSRRWSWWWWSCDRERSRPSRPRSSRPEAVPCRAARSSRRLSRSARRASFSAWRSALRRALSRMAWFGSAGAADEVEAEGGGRGVGAKPLRTSERARGQLRRVRERSQGRGRTEPRRARPPRPP